MTAGGASPWSLTDLLWRLLGGEGVVPGLVERVSEKHNDRYKILTEWSSFYLENMKALIGE